MKISSTISNIVGSRLLKQFPNVEGISFSTRSFSTNEKLKFNILFYCPRNEDHFEKFKGEYPDFIKRTNPESISVSDIAHNPENNSKAITSLLKNDIAPSIIIPHIVLIGHTKEDADQKIKFFHDSGIKSILVVRGNPMTLNKGRDYMRHPEGYEDMPHLMRRIKELSPDMKIMVAGYPEKHPFDTNSEYSLDELKKKIDHGADIIITQHFFHNQYFLGFLEGCAKRGINLPVIPSIMPIGNPKYLFSFSRAADVPIPAKVSEILFGQEGMTTNSESITDKNVEKKAVDYTSKQIQSLIDLNLPQVPRINTYTANNINFLGKVFENLGLIKNLEEEKTR